VVQVLGHEVGHVLHRHSQKRLVQERLGKLLFDALLFGDGDGRFEGLGSEHAQTDRTYEHCCCRCPDVAGMRWHLCTLTDAVGPSLRTAGWAVCCTPTPTSSRR
jgi:hypothetical protein